MRLIDSIQFADFALREPLAGQTPYLKNLSIGEFDGGTIHAPIIPICPVSGSVKHIFAMGTPGKVFEKTVGGDSITMPAFHPGRTGADEGFKYESVDQKYKVFPIFGQSHLAVYFLRAKDSLGRISQGLVPTAAPIRPYAALIGNSISGEVENRFPNFFGSVKILVSHLSALLHRVFLGLEPYSCDNRGAACLFIST